MSKKLDLTNEKYGKWTVLWEVEPRITPSGSKERYWKCQCECGTQKDMRQYDLRQGRTTSCGCDRVYIPWNASKGVDLTNKTFGRWTVLYEVAPHITPKGRKERKWYCVCSCGNERDVRQALLTSGKSQSCGCMRKEHVAETWKEKRQDLSGMKYGRLAVIEEAPSERNKKGQLKRYWWCKCDCGNPELLKVAQGTLTSGRMCSCGCYQDEVRYRNKRHNTYILCGDYYKVLDEKGREFFVNASDYNLISPYYWSINAAGYVATKRKDYKILLHKLIMGDEDNVLTIDHISGQKNDNRRCNLRIVTSQQNAFNSRMKNTNTSGAVGVGWSDERNKWESRICINGSTIHLGRYEKFEDAVAARNAAEEKYFGEYSYDNSQAIAKLNKINA